MYQQFLAAGQFRLQRCASCATHVFYPRLLCPACGSSNLAWITPSGRGKVYSTTVMRRRPDRGGDFNVALIDLDEGPRLMSRVEGLPAADVKIGMPVAARIVQGADQNYLLVFDAVTEPDHG